MAKLPKFSTGIAPDWILIRSVDGIPGYQKVEQDT